MYVHEYLWFQWCMPLHKSISSFVCPFYISSVMVYCCYSSSLNVCVCRLHRFVLDSHLATLWESNCPSGFLRMMFLLKSSYFMFVFFSLWCLWSEVWDTCIDSWSLPSLLLFNDDCHFISLFSIMYALEYLCFQWCMSFHISVFNGVYSWISLVSAMYVHECILFHWCLPLRTFISSVVLPFHISVFNYICLHIIVSYDICPCLSLFSRTFIIEYLCFQCCAPFDICFQW